MKPYCFILSGAASWRNPITPSRTRRWPTIPAPRPGCCASSTEVTERVIGERQLSRAARCRHHGWPRPPRAPRSWRGWRAASPAVASRRAVSRWCFLAAPARRLPTGWPRCTTHSSARLRSAHARCRSWRRSCQAWPLAQAARWRAGPGRSCPARRRCAGVGSSELLPRATFPMDRARR
jgi:hypothetical protein